MVNGAHFLLLSNNPEADRAFFRDVLEFHSIDIGDGWLLFRLPPAELAVHPTDNVSVQPHADRPLLPILLYLMCDDLNSTIESLKTKEIACTPVTEEPWGLRTTIRLPSGGEIGLYQPYHKTALDRDA
ncbi:MAG TPA: hypothetical protein VK673_20955 [Chthoniobacterales bacterium]|nr:hypothetical protein [Chthoniobacterales bacterium]